MACSRQQGRVLCFCASLHEEGSQRREAATEGMRIADCLQESSEGELERPRRAKRRELFLCLPPPYSAPDAASAAPVDAYSPRGLISRLLLPLRCPSPARSGGGGGAVGVGCRVRFPRCGSSNRKGREKRRAEEEEDLELKGKVVVQVVKPVVEARGGRSEPGAPVGESENTELAISSAIGKKSDELSLNLGMGVGLVFLLARSATEINKMVELREQMEILLKDIKDELQKKDVSSNCAESNIHASSASNSYRNVKISSYNIFQDDEASYHLERVQHTREPEAETRLNYVRAPRVRRCLKMDQMETELEVELERLQRTVECKISSLLPDQDQERMELASENAEPSESFHERSAEANEVYNEASSIHCGVSAHELTRRLNQLLETRQQEGVTELESSFNCTDYGNTDLAENFSEDNGEVTEVNEEASSNYCGVPARELERRLHELLETRQQERISELESALECAKRKLHEKEREICWWRDTAMLVSQHKNEALNR